MQSAVDESIRSSSTPPEPVSNSLPRKHGLDQNCCGLAAPAYLTHAVGGGSQFYSSRTVGGITNERLARCGLPRNKALILYMIL